MGKRGEHLHSFISSDIYSKYINDRSFLSLSISFTKLLVLQIAAEVSAPLAKTDEIVLIGGQDRTTAEVMIAPSE